MQTDNSKIVPKVKTLNLVTRSRLLLNSMRFMPVCAIIGLVAGGVHGLVFAIPGSFALAVMVELFAGTIGAGSSNLLYGTGRSNRHSCEQFAVTLNQARYQKMCNDFTEALITIDNVLVREPNFPEALLLKAQIIWDGFQDAVGAKQCLIEILKVEPNKKSPFHRWALSLHKEITASSSLQKTHELQIAAENTFES